MTITRRRRFAGLSAFVVLGALCSADAQERVRLAAGASSVTLRGVIKGEQTMDYVVGAKGGQTMSVKLQASSTSAYFNVLPPGSDAAMGRVAGDMWIGTLPVDGDYRVRVFLMRSAARRGEAAIYTLTVGMATPADAATSGARFQATGTVPCSVGTDPEGASQCSFGVVRTGPGRAEVHLANPGFDVTRHPDHVRVLKFGGAAVTSADPKERVSAQRKGGDWFITVDGFYFYRISETVIAGGEVGQVFQYGGW